MPFATTRRVGESVLACPVASRDRLLGRAEPAAVPSVDFPGKDAWFARVVLVQVNAHFVVLRTEASENVVQEISVGASSGLEFRIPSGERISFTVRPRGTKASFAIEAPANVLLIRSELEENWKERDDGLVGTGVVRG